MNICDSLSNYSSVDSVRLLQIKLTADCMMAITNLLNNSKSLTELSLDSCSLNLLNIVHLSRVNWQSSSLTLVSLDNNELTGCGGYLAPICARMPQLQSLMANNCCLKDNDLAMLLSGLDSSCCLKFLLLSDNMFTSIAASSLINYAVWRQNRQQEFLALFGTTLPHMSIHMLGSNLSDEILTLLAYQLPLNCGMEIHHDRQWVKPGSITETDKILSEYICCI